MHVGCNNPGAGTSRVSRKRTLGGGAKRGEEQHRESRVICLSDSEFMTRPVLDEPSAAFYRHGSRWETWLKAQRMAWISCVASITEC